MRAIAYTRKPQIAPLRHFFLQQLLQSKNMARSAQVCRNVRKPKPRRKYNQTFREHVAFSEKVSFISTHRITVIIIDAQGKREKIMKLDGWNALKESSSFPFSSTTVHSGKRITVVIIPTKQGNSLCLH